MTREAERKRLIETLSWIRYKAFPTDEKAWEFIADRLLDDGVIVPPVKVGDAIFRIDDKKVFDWWDVEHIEIYAEEIVYIDDSGNKFTEEDIGKTVFLTREQAEKALEGKGE